jgi:hypothetical protein
MTSVIKGGCRDALGNHLFYAGVQMLKKANISTLLLFSLPSGSRTTLLNSHRRPHPSFFIKLLVTPSNGLLTTSIHQRISCWRMLKRRAFLGYRFQINRLECLLRVIGRISESDFQQQLNFSTCLMYSSINSLVN